jgi:hypothetical protein
MRFVPAERMTTPFTIDRSEAVHPAAIHARTDRLRIATVQGGGTGWSADTRRGWCSGAGR